MKEYNVKVTPYAKEQMMEIRDYIAYQILNPDAARNQIIKIRAEIRKLSQFPDRIRTIDEQPWGSQGVRKIVVNNFYVYFWIDEDNAEVHVTAVAYSKRDQERVLEKVKK